MSPRRLVLATGNRGKLRELQALLADLDFQVLAQGELGVPEAEESGETFAANALLKARHAAGCTGLPAIADDSGLEVDALGGAPGVYSARYAGLGASDMDNLAKLLRATAMLTEARRGARFRCAMAYVEHAEDPAPLLCEASWEGLLLPEPRGENGFGYDPVFYVPSHGCSSAELDPSEKNRISHRGQALRSLVRELRLRYGLAAARS